MYKLQVQLVHEMQFPVFLRVNPTKLIGKLEMESHLRTVVKALSWRVIATVITFLIALLVTGEMEIALGIGGADTLLKLFAYYIHERSWHKIKFGRKDSPEYNI